MAAAVNVEEVERRAQRRLLRAAQRDLEPVRERAAAKVEDVEVEDALAASSRRNPRANREPFIKKGK